MSEDIFARFVQNRDETGFWKEYKKVVFILSKAKNERFQGRTEYT